MKSHKILPALIGSALLTALSACNAAPEIEPAAPAVVAIETRDTPPADLLICPPAPAPFPETTAQIPAPVRGAMIGLAGAYAAARDQLHRLIAWHRPGACAIGAQADQGTAGQLGDAQ